MRNLVYRRFQKIPAKYYKYIYIIKIIKKVSCKVFDAKHYIKKRLTNNTSQE